MLGFIIGTVCLIGLIKVIRRGRYGHGYGGYGGYGGCGSSGWGGRGWGRHHHHEDEGGGPPWARWGGAGFGDRAPFFLRFLFNALDTTAGQEKVIKEAVTEVRDAARNLRSEGQSSRTDVGKAVRGESFDEVLFGEMFHRHDVALEGMRKTVLGALAKVHAVLDDNQRAKLADLIERGPQYFRGGQGQGQWRGRDRGTYAV